MPEQAPRESSVPQVLLTGAGGYVGGRLLGALCARGMRVRCLVRRAEAWQGRTPVGVEVVAGDCLDADAVARACAGVGVAYYLVHSLAAGAAFEERDRAAAVAFARGARAAGLRRIVYLGGLADERQRLSPHLRSRIEVGRILRDSGIPCVELRASIVLGSGSLSFELVRSLVERLPLMVTPRWVETPAQPIAIADLLEILVRAADVPPGIYEIGGSERTSYAGLMREYARQRGLRRLMLRVPVLTPRLSALWLALVTPVLARVGRHLIESIRSASVVTRPCAELFGVRPVSVREAIQAALADEDREYVQMARCDAASVARLQRRRFGGAELGRRLVDAREIEVATTPERAFAAIERIGGANGWYAHDWLWRLRGALDRLAGGVGLRRGRPHPTRLAVGDALDGWRVQTLERGRRLRLAAEMRLPGRAWLDFEVEPSARGAIIRQIASFDPRGFAGLAYWYSVYPVHALVFRDLLGGIAAHALAPGDD
jgi:uncharacterized protein YbjT (DUF2867 family)